MTHMTRGRLSRAAALLVVFGWSWVSPPPVEAQFGSLIVNTTSPSSGSTVSGTVTVSASVTILGLLTVSRVDFYVDGTLIGSDSTTPYAVAWDTRAVGNGSHTVLSVAQDNLGVRWNADPVTVTVSNPPTISSFSPTSGPVGTSVTISGTNFGGASAVRFNGTSAGFTVNSSASITATVPGGASTGTISVTTSGGTATSAGSFTVTASPP